jgi:type II secretory pathway component PulK
MVESAVRAGNIIKQATKNQRGVALIIVLLVTALLIALIFEFAYGTRISLRAAVNYRDSQRAYYVARSGVFLFGKFKDRPELEGFIPQQGEWGENPLVPGHSFRWEDEGGKLDIHQVIRGTTAFNRLSSLFTIRGIDQSTLDAMSDWQSAEQRNFYLLTELHLFLSDEEFQKVHDALTVITVPRVNINTASEDVLRSIGPLDPFTAKKIIERRPFTDTQEITNWLTSETALSPGDRVAIVSSLTTSSNVFKVDSVAKVGGYTKQIEAIITKGTGSTVTINYWREL